MTPWSTSTELDALPSHFAGAGFNYQPEMPEVVMRIVSGPRRGQMLRVPGAKFAIGSGAGCTLQLRSPSIAPIHVFGIHGVDGTLVRAMADDTRLNGRSFVDGWLQVGDYLSVGPIDLEVLGGVVSDISQLDPSAAKHSGATEVERPEPEELCHDHSGALRDLRRHEHRRIRRFLQELRYHRLSQNAMLEPMPVQTLAPAESLPAEPLCSSESTNCDASPSIAPLTETAFPAPVDSDTSLDASTAETHSATSEPTVALTGDPLSLLPAPAPEAQGDATPAESVTFDSTTKLADTADVGSSGGFATSMVAEPETFPTPNQARQSLLDQESLTSESNGRLNLLSLFSALNQPSAETVTEPENDPKPEPINETASTIERVTSTSSTFYSDDSRPFEFGATNSNDNNVSCIERVSVSTTSYVEENESTQDQPALTSKPFATISPQSQPTALIARDLTQSAESAYDLAEDDALSKAEVRDETFETQPPAGSAAFDSEPNSALDRIRQSLASLFEESRSVPSSDSVEHRTTETTDNEPHSRALELNELHSRLMAQDSEDREIESSVETSVNETHSSMIESDSIDAAEVDTLSTEEELEERSEEPSAIAVETQEVRASEPDQEMDPLEKLRYLQSLTASPASQEPTPVAQEDDTASAEPTAELASKASRTPSSARPTHPGQGRSDSSAESSTDDDEESIDAYMTKLLARVGGTPTQASTENAEAKPRVAEPLLKQTFQKELEERQEEFKVGTYVPRTAPERMEDLKALRDVANATAKAAIDTSRQKKNSAEALAWVIGSVVSLVIGGMLLKLSTSPFSANFLGTLICLGGCAYSIRRAIQIRGQAKPSRRPTAPAPETE